MAKTQSKLQTELKQTRPFSSTRQEATLALMRTTDLVRRSMSKIVESEGITLQQYNVLRILRGAGESGLPTLEIAGRMVEEAPGITRLIDRLENKTLVRRLRCPSDRRQVLCWISKSGSELLARLDVPVNSADGNALSVLSETQTRSLLQILEIIRCAAAGKALESPQLH